MAKCAYHVWEGTLAQTDMATGLISSGDPDARHLCDEHYHAWRDGPREGPALVVNSDCKRVCGDCRAELAAARAGKEAS